MTPSFFDFFKSFYYSNTYLSPVDLSDQALSKHLLANENPQIAQIAQQLISEPEVQKVLSEPLSYDLEGEALKRNETLKRHGFKLLGSKSKKIRNDYVKMPFYSVVEHAKLPGWIIKSGASRVPNGTFLEGPMNNRNEMAFFTPEESLLRIEMANRIREVARKAKIDVIIPKKKLIKYANTDGVADVTRKYCVICEKITLLSVQQTVDTIKKMGGEEQRALARKISTLVKEVGFVDPSFDNIRLTPDGKLAFIDTEPAGLMAVKKPGFWNNLFTPKGASVEKCARIGMYVLLNQTTREARGTSKGDSICEPGLEAFREELNREYQKVATPKLSKWKITVSFLSMGLITVINTILAYVRANLAFKTYATIAVVKANLESLYTPQQKKELWRLYHSYIENVPFVPRPPVLPG